MDINCLYNKGLEPLIFRPIVHTITTASPEVKRDHGEDQKKDGNHNEGN